MKQQVDFLRPWIHTNEYRMWLETELSKLKEQESDEKVILDWEARVKNWDTIGERVAYLPCFEVHAIVLLARKLKRKLDSR